MRWLAVLAVVLGALPSIASAQAPACGFQLGFKLIADQIGTEVGQCLENEHFNLANGNAEQRTTAWHGKGGLLVWRKADNWTAYTDGANTWVNGPNGIQKRANTERFDFEAAEPVASPPPPPPSPAPVNSGALIASRFCREATTDCRSTFRPEDKSVTLVQTWRGTASGQHWHTSLWYRPDGSLATQTSQIVETKAGQEYSVSQTMDIGPNTSAPGNWRVDSLLDDVKVAQATWTLAASLRSCADFGSQAAAQAYLRANPNDPLGLDRDRDGIACESNPAPRDTAKVPR